jgi:Raf kinase inhibitor-like YbhB/YbcL family protein
MGLANNLSKTLGKAIEPIRAGEDKLASRRLVHDRSLRAARRTLEVSSTAFTNGDPLPLAFTADGANLPPPIAWSNVPSSARSLALVVEDPDAPYPRPFVHWLVYDLPVAVSSMATAPAGAHQGKNSKLEPGYTGAAPPRGHGTHRYHFQLFALDTPLDLPDGVGRSALVDAMRGHIVAWGELIATYSRA